MKSKFNFPKRKNASNVHLKEDEITSTKFAEKIQVERSTVATALSHKQAPMYARKVGPVRIYRLAKLNAWLSAHSQTAEGQENFLKMLAKEELARRKAQREGY